MITDEVIQLKNSFHLPGMKVLQFAFDGNNDNPHLPHNHIENDVVYTGTHDNDTSLGWFANKDNFNRQFMESYTDKKINSDEDGLWLLIRLAMSSVSFLCMIPMQDLLGLDSKARMNIPGTTDGNWQWRFSWDQVNDSYKQKISKLMTLYKR